MHIFVIDGKTISVFPSTMLGAPVIYLNTFADEGEKIFDIAQKISCPPFTLVAISGLNWEYDMAPWDSPPVFKSAQPCTGGADEYLRILTAEIIPIAEAEFPAVPRWRGIAGYSLAGLFAVYSIYQTDVFSHVGSISGSLWFPKIKEYIFSHEPKQKPARIYFSLGSSESKTHNPILKNVRRDTEELHAFYHSKGIDTVFQLNPGNHYDHVLERSATGIGWLLGK